MNKKIKSLITSIILTILLAFILFYLFLPPLNISSPTFWVYIMFIIAIYVITRIVTSVEIKTNQIPHKIASKEIKYLVIVIPLFMLVILIINIALSPMFNSKSYKERITINNASFTDTIEKVDFNKIPLLDKDSSQKLGDRVMGEMPDFVSQFYVSDLYTQINYKDDIIRVTPLEYDGIIKYFTNRNKGITAYITVNSVNGKSNLVQLEKGMKYMPSAILFENLQRKLRFTYPTLIFGKESFELDNEGNPYWIIPIIKYSGVGLKEEITGIITLDPITGKTKRYDVKDVPTWVDHVYSAEIVLSQVNDWGKYTKGFLNSIFGQKNVTMTTDGYNYLVMNDDVYLYTGITSILTDESNIGFVLSNLRTKETNYYNVPGAEEYSAMASAEGQVQQMKYNSTFPLLINLENRPTYLISLKDNAGLVKMYAFVDVVDYQKVVVTESSKGIEQAATNYLNNVKYESNNSNEREIVIKTITNALIDGNTYYYLTDINDQKYKVSLKTNELVLPFLKEKDKITVTYNQDKELIDIIKITK